jgi:hypothetical protein
MSRIRDCICREVLDCVYIDMGKEKRVRKWIISYLEKIDEHFVKFDTAYHNGNRWLVRHYIKEINYGFFGNIDKSQKNIRIDSDLHTAILLRQNQRNERKNLPLS